LSELQAATEEDRAVATLAPWGLREALLALLISAAVYLIPGTIFVVATDKYFKHHQLVGEMIAYQFLVLGVILSVVALILPRYPNGLQLLGYRFPGWRTLGAAGASVVLIFIGISVLYWFFSHLFPGYDLQGNAKQELPVGHHVAFLNGVLLVLFAGVLVPFTEETLFRGIIFQGLASVFNRWIWKDGAVFLSALLSGLLFGLAHGQPHTLPILAFLGICLAYIFYYGRSIYASALVHGIVNTIAVIAVLSSS
jgi:membrane protease YdiL (CAAX protease family)